MMRVVAKKQCGIRRCARIRWKTVNRGPLIMADKETGRVKWRTRAGETSR